jgi:hypothetical protein
MRNSLAKPADLLPERQDLPPIEVEPSRGHIHHPQTFPAISADTAGCFSGLTAVPGK